MLNGLTRYEQQCFTGDEVERKRGQGRQAKKTKEETAKRKGASFEIQQQPKKNHEHLVRRGRRKPKKKIGKKKDRRAKKKQMKEMRNKIGKKPKQSCKEE